MTALAPKPGFDWGKVMWSPPDGKIAPLCSMSDCLAHIAEDSVPIMFWNPEGAMAHFCDACAEKWFGIVSFREEPEK